MEVYDTRGAEGRSGVNSSRSCILKKKIAARQVRQRHDDIHDHLDPFEPSDHVTPNPTHTYSQFDEKEKIHYEQLQPIHYREDEARGRYMQASPVSATPAQSSAGATVLSHEPIDGIEHDSMVLDLMVKRERERIRETDDRATRQSQRRVELRQQFKGVTGEHKLFAGLLRPHLDAPRDVPKFEPTARGRAYTVSAPSVFDRLNNTKVGLEDCESKGTRRSCAPTHPHLFVTLQLYPWTCCSLTSHPTPGPRMACAALHRITSTSL